MRTLTLLLLVACATEPVSKPTPEPAWAQEAKRARLAYEDWGRFDDSARWAPTLCRMPPPARARRSASADGDTHGRKLYALYAKDRKSYADEELEEAPVGQVLVKESFHPVEIPAEELPEGFPYVSAEDLESVTVDGWLPYARGKDGRAWRAGERGPLFLMMKLDPQAPGTDRGWVYATVASDGAVTAAGALDSCIECHRDAPRDRQFGLPPSR